MGESDLSGATRPEAARHHARTCAACGSAFVAYSQTARFCSVRCQTAGRANRRTASHPCRGCGQLTTNPKWCSSECRVRAARAAEQVRREAEEHDWPTELFGVETAMVRDGYLPQPHSITAGGRPLYSMAEIADLLGTSTTELVRVLTAAPPRFKDRISEEREQEIFLGHG